MKLPRVSVLGSKGRMGGEVIKLLRGEYSTRAELAGMADSGDPLDSLLSSEVVIDFSTPVGMSALADAALKASGPLPCFVVGSTGWRIDDKRKLEQLSEKARVIQAANFSSGVLALIEALKGISPLLEKLGYKAVIVETHHKHKKDAPSGTALSLQRAVSPAGPGNTPAYAIRAGEVVGDHTVTFYGPADTLTFTHHAQDRSIFARGAIECATWLATDGLKKTEPGKIIPIETYFHSLKETARV